MEFYIQTQKYFSVMTLYYKTFFWQNTIAPRLAAMEEFPKLTAEFVKSLFGKA